MGSPGSPRLAGDRRFRTLVSCMTCSRVRGVTGSHRAPWSSLVGRVLSPRRSWSQCAKGFLISSRALRSRYSRTRARATPVVRTHGPRPFHEARSPTPGTRPAAEAKPKESKSAPASNLCKLRVTETVSKTACRFHATATRGRGARAGLDGVGEECIWSVACRVSLCVWTPCSPESAKTD